MKWFKTARLARQTIALADAAISQDSRRCQKILNDVGGRYGAQGVFAVMCGLGQAVAQWSGMTGREGGFYGFSIGCPDHGRLQPEELGGEEQGMVWALRFVVALANRDQEQVIALFASSRDTEEISDRIIGMLELVCLVGREQLLEDDDGWY